ncbi:MAG TPA: type II toxin-antitoxin system prevent-host-death family antitoxin [Gemmatimonadaceae bacterium]|jgi:prevent-host-death family protein|nr:type II toxin-antitoxin system prevent-host-death family antitoxin [Gemmatimonadaceae bacterium]
MRNSYSLYEAKAKLSAIIRQVREGRSAIVTLHGKPVAEIRPIAPAGRDVAARIEELVARGVIVRNPDASPTLAPIAKRPGALKRFLDERND